MQNQDFEFMYSMNLHVCIIYVNDCREKRKSNPPIKQQRRLRELNLRKIM